MPRKKIKRVWNRDDITSCRCSLLNYEHAHCPCSECDGAAVSRSTEFTHWKHAGARPPIPCVIRGAR